MLDLGRSISPRDTFAWKRGENTATVGQLMAFNGITAEALCKRGLELIK
jgi:phosphoketolase